MGKAQRQVVAHAGLAKRDAPAKFEDESPEPRVIAPPRLDRRALRGQCDRRGGHGRVGRRSRIGPGWRRPQRERRQNGKLTETRAQTPLCMVETRLQGIAAADDHE